MNAIKFTFIILIIGIVVGPALAQNNKESKNTYGDCNSKDIYIDDSQFDSYASPQGGMRGFYTYISRNLKYPELAKRNDVEGRVFVKFVVEKDGKIICTEITQSVGSECDEEAKRLLLKCPKWTPAKLNGKPVRCSLTLPINFKL